MTVERNFFCHNLFYSHLGEEVGVASPLRGMGRLAACRGCWLGVVGDGARRAQVVHVLVGHFVVLRQPLHHIARELQQAHDSAEALQLVWRLGSELRL